MAQSGDAARPLLKRELAALAFIGEGYEITQYQLHAGVFGQVSETVVSRFVRRMEERALLIAERLHGFGINRLRLTRRGKALLLSDLAPDEDIFFAPKKPVALKDLAHTTLINDLRVVIQTLENPAVTSPAWLLARRGHGLDRLVPDLLAVWPNGTRLACEVDLGCEPLSSVFFPKLRSLSEAMGGSRSGIMILTRGTRRAELLRIFASSLTASSRLLTFELSDAVGLSRLEELRSLFVL